MIGAKTLTTLALLVLAGVVAFSRGFLKPERLLGLSAETAFLIGSLATVLGALLYRFCRLSERSAHYFRFGWDDSRWEDEAHFLGSGQKGITIGQNRGEAFDLHRRLQLGICLVLALLLCLGTIDARGVQLLGGLRSDLQRGGIRLLPRPRREDQRRQRPQRPRVRAHPPRPRAGLRPEPRRLRQGHPRRADGGVHPAPAGRAALSLRLPPDRPCLERLARAGKHRSPRRHQEQLRRAPRPPRGARPLARTGDGQRPPRLSPHLDQPARSGRWRLRSAHLRGPLPRAAPAAAGGLGNVDRQGGQQGARARAGAAPVRVALRACCRLLP